MVSLAICAASSFVYDVLFLLCLCVCVFFFVCFFCCDSYHARYRIFHASSYDTYILVVRCIKRKKGAVWSLVLRRYWGACWSKVPLHIWCHMYIRTWGMLLSIFHSNISYLFSRCLVDGSRQNLFFGFNKLRVNICRSDFIRHQAKMW